MTCGDDHSVHQARTEVTLQETQRTPQQLARQVSGLSETVGGDIGVEILSGEIEEGLEQGLATHPRVTLLFLPTYGPRVNPIEQAFGDVHDCCTRSRERCSGSSMCGQAFRSGRRGTHVLRPALEVPGAMRNARVVSAERPASRHAVRGTPPHRGCLLWLKRSFDALIAGIGLLGSAPLWALIALGIKLDDGEPIFYGQKRVGQGGQQFRTHGSLKF